MSSRPSRASYAQKRKLLEFMRAHKYLATGRLNCPDGVRRKRQLLEELATALNSMGEGAKKTSDKWYKVWQDWKSDVKAKARKLKTIHKVTGGGHPPPPLSALEQEVLNFIGPVAVEGLDVPDTLGVQMPTNCKFTSQKEREPEPSTSAYTNWFEDSSNLNRNNENLESQSLYAGGRHQHSETQGSAKRDLMLEALNRHADAAARQTAALVEQAAAAARQAAALEEQAEAHRRQARAIEFLGSAILYIAEAITGNRFITTEEEE